MSPTPTNHTNLSVIQAWERISFSLGLIGPCPRRAYEALIRSFLKRKAAIHEEQELRARRPPLTALEREHFMRHHCRYYCDPDINPYFDRQSFSDGKAVMWYESYGSFPRHDGQDLHLVADKPEHQHILRSAMRSKKQLGTWITPNCMREARDLCQKYGVAYRYTLRGWIFRQPTPENTKEERDLVEQLNSQHFYEHPRTIYREIFIPSLGVIDKMRGACRSPRRRADARYRYPEDGVTRAEMLWKNLEKFKVID